MRAPSFVACLLVAAVAVGWPAAARGQTALSGDPIQITRATGRIIVDGSLSDEAWLKATRIDKWYETNPGDNVEPKVKNVGYLTYDDQFFYAAFEFEDPNPGQMRAPYADRDNIGNGFNDYGGIIVDAGNTGRTATFFVVTPHNIQYDAITDDASGEDSSPDFSGNRRRGSPSGGGRSKSGSRFRRCAIATSIRRRGASSSIATIRASATTSSSLPGCRAAATASSAVRIR